MVSQETNSPGTMADDDTVGTAIWTNPDRAKVSDNSYATAGEITTQTSHYLKATNFRFNIPTDATIKGIVVEIERKSTLDSVKGWVIDSAVKIVKSDGSIGATNKGDTITHWSVAESNFVYGSSSDLWGETWTPADIKDIDFGAALSTLVTYVLTPGSIAWVDHIRITVYYIAPLTKAEGGGRAVEHDFEKYPELTNKQIEQIQFASPHKQITENFYAKVVKVTDGDTIRVEMDERDFDFPIRFLDVDAPEMNEGGGEAKAWLKDRIEGEEVEVQIEPNHRVDKWGRLLGHIFHRGMIVSQEMIYLGLAKPYGQRAEGDIPNINKAFAQFPWT